MVGERSCIHPFIEKTQEAFQKGVSLRDALGTIKDYQEKMNGLVTHINQEAAIPHALALSTLGLGLIVANEYARSHGVSFLPDTRNIVGLVPVASISPADNETLWNELDDALINDRGKANEIAHKLNKRYNLPEDGVDLEE
ncbi:hypothetical protein HY468_00160 [Candidatus Roizmanbacteria bacterium]|nr:hypothetical protein [Candidatus Roizmanbacteria bacterium]